MNVYYLNKCGNIEKGYFIKAIGDKLTIIRVFTIRANNNVIYKIIDNYTGEVLAKLDGNQPFDPFKNKDYPFTDYDIRQVNTELEQESPAYREIMHKLFMQKLEEYIKEQWKKSASAI